ncbi:hypothetical protein [uncultured Maritalea sp.]|jgi:hypothetical protein|uniref:hypothetical protein n=1 Tax=uncultured Maritalea sp. TaxID=757249 RepID=UPI0026151795|nr:hypothetical protein [uncultured Maritalea sp.]
MAGRKRSEGFAFFLPVVGAMLVMPPIVMLFDVDVSVFGFPLIVAYMFFVWLFLVVASCVLTRGLPRAETEVKKADTNAETKL